MRSHHERFRWTHSIQKPKDSREAKYNNEVVNELNSYRALAIVEKQRYSTVIDSLGNWERGAIYDVVSPNRSGDGFSATGLRLTAPENHKVGKPTADEQLSAINFGKLIGSLAGGRILTIPSAENLTGAIPVVDPYSSQQMFYYIPAQIEPLAMNRAYFEDKPSFIVMKRGEMPSYVFWKRKAGFPPSYTDSQLLDHQRTTRSGAPTPEPRSTPAAGPATELSTVYVSGPSTSPRAASLAVDTDKPTRVAREKQIEPEWEVFDPRLEENPLEFLDYYNACLQGRKGVRSKLMLREVDIDRVNYISPCLAHNHKKADKEAEAATADGMDIDPVPTLPAPEVPGAPVRDASKAPAPKPWKQPEPISADDPAWKNFFARIDREKEIRGARIRPKPVFTSEYCNAPGTKSDPKKAVLTRELYDKMYHRAVTADRELEKRSKCCFACGLEWTLCPTTRHVHYKQHREEFKLHRTRLQESRLYVDDPLRVQDLDAAKAPMPKGVPSLNWFRDLEQKILDMENELLEREQLCRVCDAHVDFADESNADHYLKHKEERKQLRVLPDKVPSVPHTPPPKVPNGVEESPEARTWSGWKGKHTPEFLKGPGRKRGEQEAAKEQAQGLANSLEISAQQSREAGNLQNPIQISSDVSSSAASDDLEDSFMDGLNGPIHSDVIGSTSAPLAFPPLFEKMPVFEAPTSKKDSLDFLCGQEANTIVPLNPEQVSPFGRFKEKENRSARQNRELSPDPMDIDAVEAHLDYPIEIEDDDDDNLYAYPSPAPEADFGREEIIQAIRTNSGELLALNDDSEDAEEVPEDSEAEDAEDAEDVDANEDEDSEQDQDANEDAEANQDEAGDADEAGNADEDVNDDEDDSEDEDDLPPEFRPWPEYSDYSDSEDEDEDDDVDEDGEPIPADFKRMKKPRDPKEKFWDYPKYPLSGGDFVIDEITDAATGDLPLTPTERNKAREFVQEMVEEALVSPVQSDRVAIKERVQKMTRSLFAPEESKTLDAAQTLAAKILAQATGHGNLRKMNIDIQQAFSAIDLALELVHPVEVIPMKVDAEREQYIQERLEEYLFSLNPKAETKRSSKGVTKHAKSSNGPRLNTSGLLHGIRLELYDVWTVMMKAYDAFHDMIAANRKDSISDIKVRIANLTRKALVATWRYGYTDEPFAIQPVVPVRHDGLDLKFQDLKISPLLTKAVEWGCGLNNMRLLADKAWEQAVGMVKQTRERASLQEQTSDGAEQSRRLIVDLAQQFVRDMIRAEKRLRREQGQQSPQRKTPTTPTSSSAGWSTQTGGRTPNQRRLPQNSPATPTVSSARWSTKAAASDAPRAPVSPWSPVAPVNRSPTTPIVSGISDKHDGLDIEFSDLKIDHLLTEAVEWGCGLNEMRILADKAWEVAVALQEEAPERTEERRHLIGEIVQQFVRHEIKAEKRLRKQGTRSSYQNSSTTPTTSSAGWSTQTVGGRTPVNRRPSPLPTPRKRKASDASFQPGPPTPFNPDEVSPRLPKVPRRSKDPLYRPGPALPSPTTPSATPKLNKRSSPQKPAALAAKKVEKKLKRKQAKKVEKKQAKKAVKKEAKKVTFDTAKSSKPSTSAATSKSSSPQVVITKKPTKKIAAAAPAKTVAPKPSSKKVVKKAAPKAGVKKTTAKSKKSKTVAPATRPKRQAAVEAEKNFGKTKVVD